MLTTIGPNRDLRIDFFRGLALWWIFTDHIPANWIAQFSLRNFALCDATEIFVLLAGYAAGLAYGRTLEKHGWLFAAADVLRRAWVLYIVHIFLFVCFSAQVSYSATRFDRADYLDEIHLDVLAEAPYEAMLQALTLSFQPAYLNILPLYITLLVYFSATLSLLKRPFVFISISFSIYLLARFFELNLPSWTGGGWYFNPFAWQLLFVIGAVLSTRNQFKFLHTYIYDIMATIIILYGLCLVWLVWPYPEIEARFPQNIAWLLVSIDKEGLHPMRLLSILSFLWLVARFIPKSAQWLIGSFARPFILCGQHSLPVFCCGIVLSFLARLAMEQRSDWIVQAAVNLGGGAVMVGVATLAAWYKQKGREPRHRLPGLMDADNAGKR